LRNFSLKAVPP